MTNPRPVWRVSRDLRGKYRLFAVSPQQTQAVGVGVSRQNHRGPAGQTLIRTLQLFRLYYHTSIKTSSNNIWSSKCTKVKHVSCPISCWGFQFSFISSTGPNRSLDPQSPVNFCLTHICPVLDPREQQPARSSAHPPSEVR